MSPLSGLYRLDLTVARSREALVETLRNHLPYTLPLLGTIIQEAETASSSTGNSGEKTLRAWTTFPADSAIPALYSILLSSGTNATEFRFFCSADPSPHPATPEQEHHIVETFQSLLVIEVAKHAKYACIPGPYGQVTAPHPTDNGFVIGSVHEKWQACLEPWAFRAGVPCTKFLHAPTAIVQPIQVGPSGYTFAPLKESDIDVLISTSHVSRTKAYIRARIRTSVCARYEGVAVAWVLTHSDGSTGSLHVEPAHRRKGLAQILMRKIVQQCGVDGDHNLRRGTFGWSFVDVIHGNESGQSFYGSLDGWKAGWNVIWYTFSVKRV